MYEITCFRPKTIALEFLAEKCHVGELKERVLCGRFIVELLDEQLSGTVKMNAKWTVIGLQPPATWRPLASRTKTSKRKTGTSTAPSAKETSI